MTAMTAMTAITRDAPPLFLPCSSPVTPLLLPCSKVAPSGKKVHERPVESRFCISGAPKRSCSPLFFSLLAGWKKIAVIAVIARDRRHRRHRKTIAGVIGCFGCKTISLRTR
jgi:hypothetical protein